LPELPVKTLLSILVESVIATLVLVVCMSVPAYLRLPVWTLPVFIVPFLLYLQWRLGERWWNRRKLSRLVIGVWAVMLVFELVREVVPKEFFPMACIGIVVLASFLPRGWLFGRWEDNGSIGERPVR
jgi:hypothetical protein